MNLNRILRHVRKSWRTLAICAVAGLLLGGLVTLLQSPSYQGKAVVLVSPSGSLGTVGTGQGADAQFIQQRAQAYVDVGTSPPVLKPAAAKAGVDPLDASSVTVEWLATSPANLAITVSEPTGRQAAAAANAVAEQLTSYVGSLERPKNGGDASVRLSVSRAAVAPTAPTSPDPVTYLLLGLLAGLVIGFPLVLARLLFRRGISDAEGLSEATGEAPFGVIGVAPSGAGLVLRDAPQSMTAEAFRKLRTSVQFATPDAAARSIVVTAPHPGAGATTVAANLALAAAEAGRRVVLVDGNLRDPGVGELLRIGTGAGLADVLSGDAELEAALRPGAAPGLTVLAAGHATGQPGSLLAGARMVTMLEQLEARADLVIIDAPPVLPYAEAAELAAIADAAVLVARYGKTNVDDLQQARSTLTQVGTTVLGVIMNGVPTAVSAPEVAVTTPPNTLPPTRSNTEAAKPELANHPSL